MLRIAYEGGTPEAAALTALTGGTVDPQHDHRIAMAAAAAACGCTAPVTVQDCACTDKSYPRFWADLAALTAVPAAEATKSNGGA